MQRKKGHPPSEALAKAQKMADTIKEIRKYKREGLTSQEAASSLNTKQRIKKLQQSIQRMYPKYTISENEVFDLTGNFHLVEKELSSTEFITGYCEVRFLEQQPRPRTPIAFARLIEQILKKRGKVLSPQKVAQIASGVLINYGKPDIAPLPGDLFERALREERVSAQERKEIQQLKKPVVIRNPAVVRSMVSLEIRTMLDTFSGLRKRIQKSLVALRQPPSVEDQREAFESIRGFEKKPKPVQERLVQEKRAQKTGKQIAEELMQEAVNQFIGFQREKTTPETLQNRMFYVWYIDYLRNTRHFGQILELAKEAFRAAR